MIPVKFEHDQVNLSENFASKLETPQKLKKFEGRSQDSTREKFHDYTLKKFKKSVWTKHEDDLLRLKVNEKGAIHWAQIATFLPNRSGKQCRERWHNHLREGVTKATWNIHQYWLLALCVRALGKKWSAISEFIPGRSDNTIKNQWNCKMKPLKEQLQLRINRFLKNPEHWKNLTEDQQILLRLISQKSLNPESSSTKKVPPKFLQEYFHMLETGVGQFQELKHHLTIVQATYFEMPNEIQEESQMPGQLSAAISAGDCFFCQSDEENPIMPKCLFR